MADITVLNQGEVADEGLQNWRGDQVAAPQGGQSVFKSSSIKLAELGERKVVGDRVFRYARAGGTIGAGTICQIDPGPVAAAILKNTGTGAVDGRVIYLYQSTSAAANLFADGYVYSQSGTAANLGQMYRIRSHASYADTSVGTFVLFDPIKIAVNAADKWSLHRNPYSNLTVNTNGTMSPMGVCGISVTTGDYFWLQTYGPACVKAGVGVIAGINVCAGATGQCAGLTVVTGTVPYSLGFAMQTLTVSEHGLVFLTIAP